MAREIEKNPGRDWVVEFVDLYGGGAEFVSVFGQETIEDAVAEAHRSLGATVTDWYRIIGARLVV